MSAVVQLPLPCHRNSLSVKFHRCQCVSVVCRTRVQHKRRAIPVFVAQRVSLVFGVEREIIASRFTAQSIYAGVQPGYSCQQSTQCNGYNVGCARCMQNTCACTAVSKNASFQQFNTFTIGRLVKWRFLPADFHTSNATGARRL